MLSAVLSYMPFIKRIETKRTLTSPIEDYVMDSPIADYVWSIGHKRFILQTKQGSDVFIQTLYVYRKPRKSHKKPKSLSSVMKKRSKCQSNLCIVLEECVY